jgi:hypothetical protein
VPKSTSDKVLVTNQAALQTKYGDGYSGQIQPAIAALIAADKNRGLTTTLIPLDDAKTMAKLNGKPVSDASDAKQNKRAIDAVCKALQPAYVCILGAVDVVPHQPLVNPVSGDGDDLAPSDLPYACDRGYSDQIEDFLAPTRVVGRLPDVTGGTDPAYLVGLLDTATKAQSLPRDQYTAYLGLTAAVWQDSTKQSLTAIFGDSTDLQDVPPQGPPWTEIGRLSHFINCHGSPADWHFYGQEGNNYPVAHDATQLNGLKPGTVLSAECCYGAQLYNPSDAGGQAGICNGYLERGAHGFFGSSTIAYGPASGNEQADLLCQFFLKHVLEGMSLGEAALQARLDFLRVLSVADPTDLKTLAQFNLMGDPSLHPVQTMAAGVTVVEGRSVKMLARKTPFAEPALVRAATRRLRRRRLAAEGTVVASMLPVARTESKKPATGGIKTLLGAELAKHQAEPKEFARFEVRSPARLLAKGFAPSAAPVEVDNVHVAVGELPRGHPKFRRFVVVVARPLRTGMVLRHLFSR